MRIKRDLIKILSASAVLVFIVSAFGHVIAGIMERKYRFKNAFMINYNED